MVVYVIYGPQDYYAATSDFDSSNNESDDENFRIRAVRSAGIHNRRTSDGTAPGAGSTENSGRTFYYSSRGDGKRPPELEESRKSTDTVNNQDCTVSRSGSEEPADTIRISGYVESVTAACISGLEKSASTICSSEPANLNGGKKYSGWTFISGKNSGTGTDADAGSGAGFGSSSELQTDADLYSGNESENSDKSTDSESLYESSYSDRPFTRSQVMTDELKEAYITLGVAADTPSASVYSCYINLASECNLELTEIGLNGEYSRRRRIRCRKRQDLVQNAWKTVTRARAIRYIRFD